MSKNAPKISYLQKLQIDHFDHSGSVERANNNSKRAFGNKIHLALGTIVHSWVGRQWPMGSRNVAKHVLAQGQSGPIPRSCRCHLSFLSFTPGRKSPPPPPPHGGQWDLSGWNALSHARFKNDLRQRSKGRSVFEVRRSCGNPSPVRSKYNTIFVYGNLFRFFRLISQGWITLTRSNLSPLASLEFPFKFHVCIN